ncbi:MAG TPA: hypothetical protein VLC08_16040 [Chitinolyticbacter sp.]|nr:hypothetical protein [Chitinolyticbacter sp.]
MSGAEADNDLFIGPKSEHASAFTLRVTDPVNAIHVKHFSVLGTYDFAVLEKPDLAFINEAHCFLL